MKEPTKADLAAAVAKLTEEDAGLRDLLAAVRAYADMPHPAEYTHPAYVIECERRLDAIAVYANGDQDGMAPGVYLLVMGDRAKELRERAARPVRYESRPEPANPPHHMTGDAPGLDCLAEDGGYICNAQDGHDEPDHVAYGSGGQECRRWPVAADAARDQPASPDAAEALTAAIAAGTPVKAVSA